MVLRTVILPLRGKQKRDYSGLAVREVRQFGDRVRFTIAAEGNELHIHVKPEPGDETGKTDLRIVYENQDLLVGMLFEEVLGLEIY